MAKTPTYDGYHKYDLTVAENYDTDRKVEAHWWHEDEFIKRFFAANHFDRLLDLPVGTGRFFPHYRNVVEVTGIDISENMLDEARRNQSRLASDIVLRLEHGDVFALRFGNREFNVAVVWRLLHLIPEKLLPKAIAELCRVTSGTIVVQTYALPRSKRVRLRRILAAVPGLRWIKRGMTSLIRGPVPVTEEVTAWSHIQSFKHSQDLVDSLFRLGGFSRTSTDVLDLYDGNEVLGTIYRRETP